MNTESEFAGIDFADLSDSELQTIAVEYRKRAMRSIETARVPGPFQASHSRHANRLVKLYLQADAELNRRDRLRVTLTTPAPWESEPDYDPAPRWLMVSVGVALVLAVAALMGKAGVW
jgi:hypothetical protein